MNAGTWENLYQSVHKPKLDPVITGFNVNIDRVIQLTHEMMRSFEQHAVPGFDEILPRLKQSMRYSAADEVFVSDPSVYRELSEFFSRTGILSVGGQAGIAAVHLHRLGIPSVICVVPGATPQVCALLKNAGIIPLAFGPDVTDRPDTIHLIFEYPPDLVPPGEGVVPRSNRFIVSPVHDSSSAIIPDASMKFFLDRISACRRAFLSGYQYLRTEQEFVNAAEQIRMIRSVHPLMRTHVELVTGVDPDVMSMMLRHILSNTDSIGFNERELGLYMQVLRGTAPSPVPFLPPSPVECVRDAIALADATGAPRVHLHAFGYYILILKSDTMNPESSRNALLLAARVTADTAGSGEQILSREGLRAYTDIRKVYGPDEMPGIFKEDDRIVVLVPAYISQNVQKTTGLGDILSSTAFVADPF